MPSQRAYAISSSARAQSWRHVEADALLGARRQRPGQRPADEKRDELAPFHSMVSSVQRRGTGRGIPVPQVDEER
jgi:hypothetical protein